MNKKYLLLFFGICFLFIAKAQTRYYYNLYVTPLGNYWLHFPKDSAEYYSDTDLDTIYYGAATMYYKTGKIYSRDFYEFGSHREAKRFYKNGKKIYVKSSGTNQTSLQNGANYKVFSLNTHVGVDNSWDSIGNKEVRQGNGYFKDYYANGNLMNEGEYKDDYREGEWKGYYPNGNLMYIGKYSSNNHSWVLQTLYSSNGDTLIKKGSGNFILHYPNGLVSIKGRYSEGSLADELLFYYPNGKIKVKSFLVHGFNDGLYETFFDNGKLACSGTYKNGRRTGEWKWYDKKGNQIRYKKYEFLN